jgi:hypothetical protein
VSPIRRSTAAIRGRPLAAGVHLGEQLGELDAAAGVTPSAHHVDPALVVGLGGDRAGQLAVAGLDGDPDRFLRLARALKFAGAVDGVAVGSHAGRRAGGGPESGLPDFQVELAPPALVAGAELLHLFAGLLAQLVATVTLGEIGQIGVLPELVQILVELLADLLGVLVDALLEVLVACAEEVGCLLARAGSCHACEVYVRERPVKSAEPGTKWGPKADRHLAFSAL